MPVEIDRELTPQPGNALQLTLCTVPAGQQLHRVHLDCYQAGQFNPGVAGNARFSPIQNEHGVPIPTLYAGENLVCALMETIFHDVPHHPGFKSYAKSKLAHQVYSQLVLQEPLQLVDLSSIALRKLGVCRNQLIDTEKNQYPATRLWARAIHTQCPQAQGLSWISRQDDSARAFMFFGDRITNTALVQQKKSQSVPDDLSIYNAVIDLAERIDVCLV